VDESFHQHDIRQRSAAETSEIQTQRKAGSDMKNSVGYIVTDVEAAIAFYTGLLGFQLDIHPALGFARLSRNGFQLLLNMSEARIDTSLTYDNVRYDHSAKVCLISPAFSKRQSGRPFADSLYQHTRNLRRRRHSSYIFSNCCSWLPICRIHVQRLHPSTDRMAIDFWRLQYPCDPQPR
jgi:hypothetical protein